MFDIRKIIAATCDAIAETLYPTRCVGCEEPGSLLCSTCENALERINLEIACPRCGAPFGKDMCTECPPPGSTDSQGRLLPPPYSFDAARCACSYEGICRHLIGAYKDGGERRLADHIAHELHRTLAHSPSWLPAADLIVPIPPTPSHLRERGWYPVGDIATCLSERCGIPLVHALESSKAADQRTLDREMRMHNRTGTLAVKPGCEPIMSQGPTVVLLDDVLTTGATCNAAAHALKSAGAKRVLVTTYARVW